MNIDNIIQQLIIDEGLRLKSYYCPTGYLTIGIGRNLETNGMSWAEMIQLIETNPLRKARFPKDYHDIESEDLFLTLLRDFELNGITKEEAIFLCKNDVYECEAALKKKLKWFEDKPEELKEVLVNMCFNLGVPKLLGFRNTLHYMEVGDYEKAATNMLKSKWARQVKSRAIRLSDRVKALSNV